MSARAFSLSELRRTALAECERIDLMQDALVKAGLRTVPDVGEMHKAERFAAIARLIDLVKSDPVLFEEFKRATARLRPKDPVARPADLAEAE